MTDITIAIDCMGGDFGPPITIPAVKRILHDFPEVNVRLYGDSAVINKQLDYNKVSRNSRIRIHQSQDDVSMQDSPAIALKNKKESSMRLALEAVRDGRANACISAGNTGALMAIARFVLKMQPGIDRPAIVSPLPTINDDHVFLLDLGANVDCDEKRLTQFAIMGDELVKCLDNNRQPKVGLLNVGAEDHKGSDKLKSASDMIAALPGIDYAGFVEGDEIFSGDYQVIVTDGFTGNNVLKASEGLTKFLNYKIKSAFKKNLWTRFCGMLAKPVIAAFKAEVNPEKYNGACLLGLRGIVVKSHGSASVYATYCAIEEAIIQSNQNLPERIRAGLQDAQETLNHTLNTSTAKHHALK